jgi:ligand-binding sensor domain-containing protein/serine phosphatase RsbU (regulator of sigma subunit)
MRRALFLTILAGYIFSISDVSCQTPFLKPHNLFMGKEEYNVRVIYQAPKGWIWIGTDHGLFRYDGISYIRYTTSEGLADNNITAIKCVNDQEIWIGHKSGKITLYDGNVFWQFKPEEGLGNIEITDIEADSLGVIWYSTLGEGIYKYNGRHLTNLNTDDGISDNYVYDIEKDSDGIFWLATDNGITRIEDSTYQIISMKEGLNDNIVRVLKSSEEGRIWIGTEDKGLSVYDTYRKTFSPVAGWNFGPVTGLAMSLEDEIWISTEKQGIVQLKLPRSGTPLYHQITEKEGLISNRINTIAKDSEGNMWIGGKQGVIQALPPAFEFLNKHNGTPFEMAYSIIHDIKNNLWVCSESGLYRGITDVTGQYEWENVSIKMNIGKVNFISLYIDPTGQVWAGTYGGGAYRINPDNLKFSKYTTPYDLNDNNVISVSGNDSLVWLSTLGGGVSCYNLKKSSFIKFHYPELLNSYIYSARTTKSGKTWIAGSLKYPAYILNDSLYFIRKEEVRFPQLYSIAEDSSGSVWFNTGEKGIIRLLQDTTELLDKNDGISFDQIQSIVFDKFNNLLVISNRGFLFYKPGKGILLELGDNSGLSYQYPVLNSVYTDKDGHIWIGTETGIIIYNPDYLKFIGQNPKVFLSSKNLFYNPIKQGKIKFRYDENNFTFGYTGIWFSNPEGLTYRYKLKGYDLEWLYSNRNQTLTYSQLPAGNYTFMVEVSLDGKTWYSSDDSSYSFYVKPPFWKTWWFIVTAIIVLVNSIFLYIRQRVSNLEKEKEKLELEVAKRTEEIRNKNSELEIQKTEIALQRDLAEEQRDKIEAQKEEIQSSIRYAHRIQTAVLPPKKLLDGILKEYFILNKPRDIVSGDFYWVARNNSFSFFSVGDCTGHGVPGSIMSMLGISALNDIVKSLKLCKASSILDLLRERIHESLHQSSERELTTYDGMDISLCIFEPETMTIQFSGAHNPMYLIRNGIIQIYPADQIDIGRYLAEKREFTNHIVNCKSGDIIYLFSDGYADQFGGPKVKKYKSQKFRNFLVSIHNNSMEDQRRMLDEEIENWRGNLPQIDDILVMGIRIQ